MPIVSQLIHIHRFIEIEHQQAKRLQRARIRVSRLARNVQPLNRVAADGSDRLIENRVAADGSDRLMQNRVAEGGSDRLIESRAV